MNSYEYLDLEIDHVVVDYNSSVLDLILSKIDIYDEWYEYQRNYRRTLPSERQGEFYHYDAFRSQLVYQITRALKLFNPVIKQDLASQGKIDVETVVKFKRRGKRTEIKMGRFLTNAFPFIKDVEKESIVTDYVENFSKADLEVSFTKEGFKDIVTLPCGKRTQFVSDDCKQLMYSCMRHSVDDLGLKTYHPYEAYETGDWILAYIKEGSTLSARCLINEKSGTYAPIYTVSMRAYQSMKSALQKEGYYPDNSEGEAWLGSELKYLEDTWHNEEDECYEDVVIMPYLDNYEYCAYTDGKKIILGDERPLGESLDCQNPNGVSF